MIKVGKLTDYAVFIMARLASDTKRAPRSAKYLAGKTGIPEPTVAKILKKLARGGMLLSSRGAAGGYRVHDQVEDITLLDIINLIEGPVAMVTCNETQRRLDCMSYNKCVVRSKWQEINQSVIDVFKNTRLVDMISEETCGNQQTAVINACNIQSIRVQK